MPRFARRFSFANFGWLFLAIRWWDTKRYSVIMALKSQISLRAFVCHFFVILMGYCVVEFLGSIIQNTHVYWFFPRRVNPAGTAFGRSYAHFTLSILFTRRNYGILFKYFWKYNDENVTRYTLFKVSGIFMAWP